MGYSGGYGMVMTGQQNQQSQQTSQLLAFGVGLIKGVILGRALAPTPAPAAAAAAGAAMAPIRDVQTSSKLRRRKVVVIKKIIVAKPTAAAALENPTGGGQEKNDMDEVGKGMGENPRQFFQTEEGLSGP